MQIVHQEAISDLHESVLDPDYESVISHHHVLIAARAARLGHLPALAFLVILASLADLVSIAQVRVAQGLQIDVFLNRGP